MCVCAWVCMVMAVCVRVCVCMFCSTVPATVVKPLAHKKLPPIRTFHISPYNVTLTEKSVKRGKLSPIQSKGKKLVNRKSQPKNSSQYGVDPWYTETLEDDRLPKVIC